MEVSITPHVQQLEINMADSLIMLVVRSNIGDLISLRGGQRVYRSHVEGARSAPAPRERPVRNPRSRAIEHSRCKRCRRSNRVAIRALQLRREVARLVRCSPM